MARRAASGARWRQADRREPQDADHDAMCRAVRGRPGHRDADRLPAALPGGHQDRRGVPGAGRAGDGRPGHAGQEGGHRHRALGGRPGVQADRVDGLRRAGRRRDALRDHPADLGPAAGGRGPRTGGGAGRVQSGDTVGAPGGGRPPQGRFRQRPVGLRGRRGDPQAPRHLTRPAHPLSTDRTPAARMVEDPLGVRVLGHGRSRAARRSSCAVHHRRPRRR
ncbi:hypothetical protein SBRY_70024 [Actinacidiphila bryophytorum]|uniref:Uncharacterized protein n=1 Tax=Actinacidiphila bryophytorum TaxID=1436133 RepID=A0A9W4H637_9ACTN|nr:hypothetical protein SBRY_70024 [Actinacidiphila bryophytorum]